MKTLLSALVLTAASVLPVSAGLHDFTPANAAAPQAKTRIGYGSCVVLKDTSELCYIKTSANGDFSIAIKDVDFPGKLEVSQIDCSTGYWFSYGGLPEETLDLYLDNFCSHV